MEHTSAYSPGSIYSGRVGSLEEGEELKEEIDGIKFDKENVMRKSASSSDISKEQGNFINRDLAAEAARKFDDIFKD